MTHPTTDDELDRLLATAAFAHDDLFDDLLVAAVRDVVAATPIPSDRRERRPRRRGRRWAAVAVAVVGVSTTAAFAYHRTTARTGIFGPAGMTENDTSEWLDSGAADFDTVVRELVPTDIPLPPGASFDVAVRTVVENGTSSGGLVQVTGVRATFESYAACSWESEWFDAFTATDPTRENRAVAVLRAVPYWPMAIKTDGGGVRELERTIADAAAAGNPAPVRNDLDVNCTAWTASR